MTKAIATVQKYRFTPMLMAVLGFIFVALYIASIFSIVRNTSQRSYAEAEINKLSAIVGDLEFSYIALRGSFTPESAGLVGLSPVRTLSYVSRASTQTALAVQNFHTQ